MTNFTEAPKITVYVCEPQPIIVEGLRQVVESSGDLEFAGDSRSGYEAIDRIGDSQPTVVLLDYGTGLKPTFDLLTKIRARSARSHTVLWVNQLTEVESFRALQTGARGILKKSMPVRTIVECLRAVGQGNLWIENSISNQVVGFLNRRNLPRLTPRESEIVSLVSRGMKNRQIADELRITTGTVKVHLMHIFEKTGVKDRFELALEAQKLLGPEALAEPVLVQASETLVR